LALALPVFVFLAARYHGAVMHARQWLLGLVALGGGVLIYIASHGWGFVAARINPALEAHVGRGIGSGRLEVWDEVVRQIGLLDGAHALVGVGLMGYRYLPGAFDLHPHNWLLQVILETGALGTLGFLGFISLVGYYFDTYARGNLYGVAAFTSLAAFLATGLFSTSIFNMWWVTFLVMSMLIGWRAGWAGTPTDGNSRRKVRSVRMLSRADLASPVAAPARGKKA
jgi:O-antigen ligase